MDFLKRLIPMFESGVPWLAEENRNSLLIAQEVAANSANQIPNDFIYKQGFPQPIDSSIPYLDQVVIDLNLLSSSTDELHRLRSALVSTGCFQELDLNYQIERSSATLKTLQDLDHMLKKYEAIEKIEESFSTLKVTEFEGNCIRLSLKTYIPHVEGLMHHQKLTDNVDPFELNHELQIEVMNVGMQLKNAEIFPNDVYLGDILEALNSFRLVFLHPTLWKLLLLLSGLLAQSLLLSLALSSKKLTLAACSM